MAAIAAKAATEYLLDSREAVKISTAQNIKSK